jgi:hypothetical protein
VKFSVIGIAAANRLRVKFESCIFPELVLLLVVKEAFCRLLEVSMRPQSLKQFILTALSFTDN